MLSMSGNGDPDFIARELANGVLRSGLSCELIADVTRMAGGAKVRIMVFEKYYMRSSNRASLTVALTSAGNDITVDAVGAGGGQGAVFRFSWGAEENFVSAAEKVLRKNGFR